MKTIWSKKVKWFKSKKAEIIISELEWEYTYFNALGEPVECVIIQRNEDGTVDVINKNKVKVFDVPFDKLTKIV